MLTARETMKAVDRREITREIRYTKSDGTHTTGFFTPSELVRCELCNRNQPTDHLTYHMAWDHGK